MPEYVSSLRNSPGLLDIVAQISENDNDDNPSDQRFLFPPHWSMEEMRAKIKVKHLVLSYFYSFH